MAVMKLRPLGSNIVIKIDDRDERVRKSGLIVMQSEGKAPQTGEIIAIGPDCAKTFELGSIVVFEKFAGHEFTDPDSNTKLIIINDEEIVATLK